MQLSALVEYLEKTVLSQQRFEKALEELLNRFLVEESIDENNQQVLGLHNLVRSVALEHLKSVKSKI
ncbi:MAG: hypothetical protein QNJ33_19010 [Crocosphaera sp.]|nr:hypothetical protein [Crocosphaera sp.]